MTKKQEMAKELIKRLKALKKELELEFEEVEGSFIALQMLKEFGWLDTEEKVEEANAGILVTLVSGSIINAVIGAVDEELRALNEVVEDTKEAELTAEEVDEILKNFFKGLEEEIKGSK